MIVVAAQHFESSAAFIADTERHSRSLREHKPIKAFDVTAMMYQLNARQNESDGDEI